MRRRVTVEQWRRDVFASSDPRMSAAVKVLCLFLADHMNRDDHKVSLPRDTIAKALSIHRARVAERLTKAVDAKFLGRVSAGAPGRTAVYQATWPGECVQQSGTHTKVGMRPAKPDAISTRRAVTIFRWAERETAGMDTALLDANIEADLSLVAHGRDVGNDEETEEDLARYGLTVCDCHGFTDCISLSSAHREETA